MEIRSFTFPYCVQKRKEKSAFKKSLEKELNNLQKSLDMNPNQVSLDHFQTSKKELEKTRNTSPYIQIAIQWLEEGEKNSNFFLNLEKKIMPIK